MTKGRASRESDSMFQKRRVFLLYEIEVLIHLFVVTYNSITKFENQDGALGVLMVSLNIVPFEMKLYNAGLAI